MFLNWLWVFILALLLAAVPAAHTTPTAIYGNRFFNANPNIVQGHGPVGWGFEVVPQGKAQVLNVPVKITIDGKQIGKVAAVSQGTVTCLYILTNADTMKLKVGPHTLKVTFAGNKQYTPSSLTATINVYK
jgi:hypothetical protein